MQSQCCSLLSCATMQHVSTCKRRMLTYADVCTVMWDDATARVNMQTAETLTTTTHPRTHAPTSTTTTTHRHTPTTHTNTRAFHTLSQTRTRFLHILRAFEVRCFKRCCSKWSAYQLLHACDIACVFAHHQTRGAAHAAVLCHSHI